MSGRDYETGADKSQYLFCGKIMVELWDRVLVESGLDDRNVGRGRLKHGK
jgi:hypothetical protein